ncbi:site-specific integrase [Rouxiella chamberiensis]|uniref:Site-specific integrase n=1 Tax=Rouxiella chamberiensis TaxID=1513468 RepID=A0ABY7HRY1_9GAMM|nr:site-specific integrase [Rouxiella chamberiensis]WAT02159.1 site-specific integrase [Rouxiella chamberiensis]CNK75233.1 Site-specific recombinase XerD [Yersinia intermedia]
MSIILWEVPDFVVDQKINREIDTDTGELSVNFVGEGQHLGKLPLLFMEDGSSIRVANNWLIHLKANLRKKEVNTQAQALLHYFTFLHDIGMSWDEMPISLRLRPTYAFRKHLREMFKQDELARSTANSYMGSVINFYKFYLARDHFFAYPPFKYEVVRLHRNSPHEYMRNHFIHVDTTDLRLKLPNDTRHFGLSRKLVPISSNEWQIVESVYKIRGLGVSTSTGEGNEVPLSEECKLAIDLSRYSGLRRSEIISLRVKQIYKPDTEQLKKKYLINTEGLLLDPRQGVKTKNGTIRTAEIHSELMQTLYDYINSSRYIKRRNRYQERYPEHKDNPPLLLNQNGKPYAAKTLDARWCEIRNAVRKELPNFSHKFHNLRSTYAVERLKELLNAGLKEGKALDYLQSMMGHKSRATLLGYLKFCEEETMKANEVHEKALNIILKSD